MKIRKKDVAGVEKRMRAFVETEGKTQFTTVQEAIEGIRKGVNRKKLKMESRFQAREERWKARAAKLAEKEGKKARRNALKMSMKEILQLPPAESARVLALRAEAYKTKPANLPLTNTGRFLWYVVRGIADNPLPAGYGSSPTQELCALDVREKGLATWDPSKGWTLTAKGWGQLELFFTPMRVKRMREKSTAAAPWILNRVGKRNGAHDKCCVCGDRTWSGKAEVDHRRRFCGKHGPRQLARKNLVLPTFEWVRGVMVGWGRDDT